MPRSLEERLQDIRQAAIDLRDFIADMETAAFHALPHADRKGFRAVKNALTELGEAAKAIPEETRALTFGVAAMAATVGALATIAIPRDPSLPSHSIEVRH